MDLLAVRPESDGGAGWHVEVTVSFRPIGYIAREPAGDSGRGGSHVRKRTPEQVQAYDRAWVEAKFRAAFDFALLSVIFVPFLFDVSHVALGVHPRSAHSTPSSPVRA